MAEQSTVHVAPATTQEVNERNRNQNMPSLPSVQDIEPDMEPSQPPMQGETASTSSRFMRWLLIGMVLIIAIVLIWYGPQLWQLVQDEEALEAWVSGLGWLGPVALIALNAIQIVVAPIPGYVVQVASGFLFGPIWGGVWASVGLLLGASMAFWLARFYGRPLANRLVGEERLAKWESVSHSDNTLVWFILLVGPVGDLPYFLAGLAKVSFAKVFIITLLVRVPSTFVIAAAGAGVMVLSWWQMAAILVLLFVMVVIFMRYQDQIIEWSDRRVRRRVDYSLQKDADPLLVVENGERNGSK